eukprot:gene3491-4338_t
MVLTGDLARDSRDGVELALIEFKVLSHCQLILNTYGSSFAVEAAQSRQVPLVGIWGGFLIHHDDLRLPYCGHMHYVGRAIGNATSFKEGTADRRRVNGSVLAIYACTQLVHWGFRNLYCVRSETS